MKQQAIKKLFNTAKHSQPDRLKDFQIDQISENQGKQKKDANLKQSDAKIQVNVKLEGKTSQKTASSTKKKVSKIRVVGQKSVAALDFDKDEKPIETEDFHQNREVLKKRKIKGKLKLNLFKFRHHPI